MGSQYPGWPEQNPDGSLSNSWAAEYLAGNVVGCVFGAFVIAQGFYTLDVCRSSHPWFRITIAISIVCFVGLLVCLVSDTLDTFAVHWGDLDFILGYTPFYCTANALFGIIAGLIQGAYAFRAWHLLECCWWLVPVLVALPLWTAVSWSYAGFASLSNPNVQETFVGAQMTYIAPVVTDVTIMVLMSIGLWRLNIKVEGDHRAKRLIQKLALLTVSCNGITTAVCVFQLINCWVDTGAFYVLDPIIPSLYLGSLCTWLHFRQKLAPSDHTLPVPPVTMRSQGVFPSLRSPFKSVWPFPEDAIVLPSRGGHVNNPGRSSLADDEKLSV